MDKGKDVYFQGSRQMTNVSRRYYERELGAGMAPSPNMKEFFGYSEPLRRFFQPPSSLLNPSRFRYRWRVLPFGFCPFCPSSSIPIGRGPTIFTGAAGESEIPT